jgi:acyl-CoA synthetase (AMP-forming)/AMP-acid ligase II
MVTLPPSILSAVPAAELPALRTLITAGEACRPDLIAAWKDGRTLINAYGPTEATVCSTFTAYHENGKPNEATSRHIDRRSSTVPIGKPLTNTQAFILDRALEPVPAGVIGELHLGGSGLGRGYLNRPDLTAERFIPSPYSIFPGDRLYRTGDTARFRPDGTIEFIGRIDNQVKIRGFRIEPGEIESALREHTDISECVVAASSGNGETRLIAYYVSGETISPLALRRFLRERIPGYMVPMEFIHIDAVPRTSSGKIDRERLRTMRGRPDGETRTFAPPHSDAERAVAAIWSDVLGVRDVGLNDNFFDLGGYSLLVVKAVARMEEELGFTPKVGDFIRLTLGQMAGRYEAGGTANDG